MNFLQAQFQFKSHKLFQKTLTLHQKSLKNIEGFVPVQEFFHVQLKYGKKIPVEIEYRSVTSSNFHFCISGFSWPYSVEHDEKSSHIKFFMNQFMVA